MVAAEIAVARLAEEKGIRSAFMAYLAPGAVMFAPDQVDGLAFYSGRPDTDARLQWYPSDAAIATSGDLGYTAGPYEYAPGGADTATGYGHFASVWRRNADGVWKVELALGGEHPRPRSRVRPFNPNARRATTQRYLTVGPLTPAGVERVLASLLALDSAFARTARAQGTATALDQFAAEQIRLQRPFTRPVVGRRPAVRLSSREPGTPRWEPRGGGAAISGEFGYTWGAVRWDTASDEVTRGYYLRVWRRQADGWRVLVDFVSPRDG